MSDKCKIENYLKEFYFYKNDGFMRFHGTYLVTSYKKYVPL